MGLAGLDRQFHKRGLERLRLRRHIVNGHPHQRSKEDTRSQQETATTDDIRQLGTQLQGIERTIIVQGSVLVHHLLALLHMYLAVSHQILRAAHRLRSIRIGWSLILEILEIHALLHSVAVVAIILQIDVHHLALEIHRHHAELERLLCRGHHPVSRHPIVTVLLHRASVIEIRYTTLPHQTPGPIHKWAVNLRQATVTATHVLLQTVLQPVTMTILVDHATPVNIVSQLLQVHLQLRSPCPLTIARQQTLSSPPPPVPEAALPSDETTHGTHPTTAHLLIVEAAATTALPRATRLPHRVISPPAPAAAVVTATHHPMARGPVRPSVRTILRQPHTPAPSASTPISPLCLQLWTVERKCQVGWIRHRKSDCSSWKRISAS